MAILVDRDTRILVQGITGRHGSLHARLMREYGAHVVAGVTPGKGGSKVSGVPVYDTVALACEEQQPNASLLLVPPAGTLEAGLEAVHAGIPLVVIVTEHVPVLDAVRIRASARERGVALVGPNTIGVISPGRSKVGIMPGILYREGSTGVISRSGTLAHEVAVTLAASGIGESTCIGIGGDPVGGLDFVDVLKLFRDDAETEAVLMVGEIGGNSEERAARYLKEQGYPKPVIAFIAGRTAPSGCRMGHAGAIIREGSGAAADKIEALRDAGVEIVETMDEMAGCLDR